MDPQHADELRRLRTGEKPPFEGQETSAAELRALADERERTGRVSAETDLSERMDYDSCGWDWTLTAYANRLRAIADRLAPPAGSAAR